MTLNGAHSAGHIRPIQTPTIPIKVQGHSIGQRMNQYGSVARMIHLSDIISIGEYQFHGLIAGRLAGMMILQLISLGAQTFVGAVRVDAGLRTRHIIALVNVHTEVRTLRIQLESGQTAAFITHHLVNAFMLTNIRNEAFIHIAQCLIRKIGTVIPPVAQQIRTDAGAIFATEIVGAIAGTRVGTKGVQLIGSIGTVRFAIARLILEDAFAILAFVHLSAAWTGVRRINRLTALVLIVSPWTVLVAIAHIMRIDAQTLN